MKIVELSKELNLMGKQVLDKAKEFGINAKSLSSVLTEEDERQLRSWFLSVASTDSNPSSAPSRPTPLAKPIEEEETASSTPKRIVKKDPDAEAASEPRPAKVKPTDEKKLDKKKKPEVEEIKKAIIKRERPEDIKKSEKTEKSDKLMPEEKKPEKTVEQSKPVKKEEKRPFEKKHDQKQHDGKRFNDGKNNDRKNKDRKFDGKKTDERKPDVKRHIEKKVEEKKSEDKRYDAKKLEEKRQARRQEEKQKKTMPDKGNPQEIKTISSLGTKSREVVILKKAVEEEKLRAKRPKPEKKARSEDKTNLGGPEPVDTRKRPKKKPHRASEHSGPSKGAINQVGSKNYLDKKKRENKRGFRDAAYDLGSLEKVKRPKNKPKPQVKVEEPEILVEELPVGTIVVNVPITVAGLADQAQITTSTIIMSLMKMGIISNINQSLDEDTVVFLAEDLGISVKIGSVDEIVVEEGIEAFDDEEGELVKRAPIITVMGHVDHGKTSLLDAIRNTDVTKGEAGGITQHIGASEVKINGEKIVFLDTPGHEAFTAMRARGAHITDIAVLVVAADDGVMPQTIESISHAKAAGVPIIVAINKIDKPGASLDKIRQDLSEHGLLVEDWGGKIISVPVSAKTGEGVKDLLEMILLQAEVLELRANPNRRASGTVIEARLDKSKGSVATLLVLNGTLKSGDSVVAGVTSGRIRVMHDHKGKAIKKAGPATAVEITGLTQVPYAGDEFNAVKDDKLAKNISQSRQLRQREEVMTRTSHTSLETFFSQLQEGEVKELNLIIKGDVQGSVGAVTTSLEKLANENAKVHVIHTGVGAVTESDVMLANTSNAIIIGFNVRPSTSVLTLAERDDVEIRTYRVIYDIIDDIESALKGMLDPEFKEVVLGKLEIREVFKVPNLGNIGGAYVLEGKIERNAEVRLVRDGVVIFEGKLGSLRRFKDDVKEVAQGYECGVGIESYNDIKQGDIVEAFKMEEVKRA